MSSLFMYHYTPESKTKELNDFGVRVTLALTLAKISYKC